MRKAIAGEETGVGERGVDLECGKVVSAPFVAEIVCRQSVNIILLQALTFPLAGSVRWRTGDFDLPYTAKDRSIENRETLDHVLASLPPRTLLYVDPRQNRIKLPSQDVTALSVDGFLLFPFATPIENRCTLR